MAGLRSYWDNAHGMDVVSDLKVSNTNLVGWLGRLGAKNEDPKEVEAILELVQVKLIDAWKVVEDTKRIVNGEDPEYNDVSFASDGEEVE